MRHVVEIKDDAFAEIRRLLRERSPCNEYVIQKRITDAFADRDLITDHPPIVAVNANSGNPHYEPTCDRHDPIAVGDWVLIDLWAKEQGPEAVFADITWVGYVGAEVPRRHREVFGIVAAARDAVVAHLREHRASPGYELDRVARKVIADGGYGEQFAHRTGHSLSTGEFVHGLGANLDDLETHDTRVVQAGLGFTIEPGIYLPEFGVRSEINVFMSDDGPVVTSPAQTGPVLMTVT
jgi:Xaa-Pro aminopeptidase